MSGSVTNPTGSVNGKSLTGMVDAMTIFQGITEPANGTMAQWQLAPHLTDRAGICLRFVGGMLTYQPGELSLRIVVTGWKETGSAPWVPPVADVPLVLPVVDPGPDGTTSSDGVHRLLRVYFMQASKNGRAGSDTLATGGSVTFTVLDDSAPDRRTEGSYDLTFPNGGSASGSFVAPFC